ncbi:unnamed protein product [Rotaria sp. Silwood2]|nr:unnamed protein product [Rotaria sp. Silwood2]
MTLSMMISATHWNVPYLFKGATIIDDSHSWIGGQRLADLLKQKLLSFRVGKRQKSLFGDRVQFEKDCIHIQSTVDDFLCWTTSINNDSLPIDHPLKQYSNKEYFAYADYMHIPELFENDQHPLINMIKWSDMGLKNRCGKESTLWIGSQGSHTPCHYDTYGINFVAQIVGKKRWLLFPPNSPIGQLQTRIPYEESSVYLDIDPSNIDVYDITLEPGDVLFVPKHWWHFVSSLDSITISVNSWLDQPDDHVERIKEMLVRQIITSTMIAHDYSPDQWLNHREIATDPTINLTLLSSLLTDSNSTEEVKEPPSKRCRYIITPASNVHEQRLTSALFGHINLSNSSDNVSTNTCSDESNNEILLKRLLKAMTAPDTIDLIYNKLLSV